MLGVIEKTEVEILLDGLTPVCYRCEEEAATMICKVKPHGCHFDARLWAFCDSCAEAEGACRDCGALDLYYIRVSGL